MRSVREPHWVVELNIAGCRIQRWAQRRRELLVPNPRTFAPPEASEAGAA